jgi:hypothetical protein
MGLNQFFLFKHFKHINLNSKWNLIHIKSFKNKPEMKPSDFKTNIKNNISKISISFST